MEPGPLPAGRGSSPPGPVPPHGRPSVPAPPPSTWLVLLRTTFLAAVVSAAGCAPGPRQDLAAAHAALQRASAGAPGACAAARSVLLLADAEVRVQEKRWPARRDYREAEALALRARIESERCLLHGAVIARRTRERVRRGLDAAEARLAEASALARHVPDREQAQSDLTRAGLTLAEGRGCLERGELDRAEDAAGRGRDQIAAVVGRIAGSMDAFRRSPRRSHWRRWTLQTIRESRGAASPVILVDKLRRRLFLLRRGEVVAEYPVDLGMGGIEKKTRAGDDATPEGRYRVTEVRGPGRTRYYKALMLDYPNEEDRANFRRLQRKGAVAAGDGIGSLIEIHGHGGRGEDWTRGCVALDNADMDDLVPRVGVGTRVTIVGTVPDDVVP